MRFFRRKPKPAPRYRVCDVEGCERLAYRAYATNAARVFRCPAHPLESGVLNGTVDMFEVTSFSSPFALPIDESF